MLIPARIRPILASLAFAAFLPAALAADFARVVETLAVSGEASGGPAATHDLCLHLYAFQGGRWQSGDIVVAVWEALELLAPCGVSLSGAELSVLDEVRGEGGRGEGERKPKPEGARPPLTHQMDRHANDQAGGDQFRRTWH